ncbi:MAG: hypothetical protein M3Z84_01070 [Actinomycetota bacterium]|nr:hypothetical protein [Actinomycetota bacterium]
MLRQVLDTSYGRAWMAQMALAVALVLPEAGLARRRGVAGIRPDAWIALGALLVGGICVAAACSGHARTGPRPALTVASVALHLFGAGV